MRRLLLYRLKKVPWECQQLLFNGVCRKTYTKKILVLSEISCSQTSLNDTQFQE